MECYRIYGLAPILVDYQSFIEAFVLYKVIFVHRIGYTNGFYSNPVFRCSTLVGKHLY